MTEKLLTDIQLADRIGLPCATDRSKKRRLRAMAKEKGVQPVHRFERDWLWNESAMIRLCSELTEEKAPPITRSPGRTGVSAYERVRARLTKKQPNKSHGNASAS